MKKRRNLKMLVLAAILSVFLGTLGVLTVVNVLAKKENKPLLEKITFIHYKKGFARKPSNGKALKPATCYSFLAKGAKWKTLPVNYVINPQNPDNLGEEFIKNAIYQSAEEWDNHTSSELFGSYSLNYNASWDRFSRDGKNELVWGNYPENGVIAVTNIWGYFSGPQNTRKIVEFDVMFDTDYNWGDAILNPSLMDLQNIATHEIGHGAGLSDLYNTNCSLETMYGYSNYGEIQKRDLNFGDILGIQKLYN